MNNKEYEIFFKKLENSEIVYSSDFDIYKYFYACEHKTLDIVKLLYEKISKHYDNLTNIQSIAFTYACDSNNLDIMMYLFNNYAINFDCIYPTYFVLLKPCRLGYFDVIQFVINNFSNLDYKPYRKELIDICCDYGYYQILYYLKSRYLDFDENIDHKNYPIKSRDEAFVEWFRAGCPIRTNMKSAKK